MSDKQPLVTVITPVYNRADLVEETLNSVINQAYANIEYIILNDGSTDGSLDIIKRYQDKIILESHPNMGETKTVNKGLNMATGEIIGVVNSDDPLLPGAISKIVEHFLKHPEVIVVYPDWLKIDEKGRVLDKIITPDYSYLYMVRTFHCVPGPGTFFRSSVVKQLKGRDEQFRYVADFDFWLRAGLIGPFARVPEVLATFRVHRGSASVSNKGKGMSEEHIKLVKKFYSQPRLPKEIDDLKKESYSSAYFVALRVCSKNMYLQRVYYLVISILYSPMRFILLCIYRLLRLKARLNLFHTVKPRV